MAIVHCDNFSLYGVDNPNGMLNGVYAQLNGFVHIDNDPSGVAGLCCRFNVSGQFRYVLQSPQNTVGYACRVWLASLPVDLGDTVLFDIRDVGNARIALVTINPTGQMQFTNSRDGSQVTTAAPVVTANAFWHLEFKWHVATDGSGTFGLYVEGQQVLNLTNLTYSQAPIYQLIIGNANTNSPVTWLKDFVVWDSTGAQNNDVLGTVAVKSMTPNADINSNWAKTGGVSAYQILDTTPPADGTTYISAGVGPIPAAQILGCTDLDPDTTSVRAIMTMVRAGKSDGGDGSMQVGLISSPAAAPVTGLGANRAIPTAQTYWRDIFELDPKTGLAWMPAAASAAQLQINRTA